MNVKNNNIPDWKLIYLSSLIGMSIVLNYFLWSINSYGILKYLNFFILIFFNFLLIKTSIILSEVLLLK